ncbi:MAG: hypothetical protein RIS47_15 [Bacteroidota bacterium]|jgi:hypothetical protein
MFALKNNKKKIRALTEGIVSKWMQVHSVDSKWAAACKDGKVNYNRRGFEMAFEGALLVFSYHETHVKECSDSVETKDLFYRFEFDLAKVQRVEALNLASEIVPEVWGGEELKLGVRLVPAAGSHALKLHLTGVHSVLNLKLGGMPKNATVDSHKVLDRGFILLGNGDKSDLNGKKAFDELVALFKDQAGVTRKLF